MLKNKKLLYILIPGTLLLWGIIIYKIYTVVGGNHDDQQTEHQKYTSNESTGIISDTFSIHSGYRDPFNEGKVIQNKTPHAEINTKAPEAKQVPKTLITSWPQISYSGMIKNQNSSKQLALIQINGKTVSMKIGDVVDGVQLSKVYRDSIEVKLGKEKKFISK